MFLKKSTIFVFVFLLIVLRIVSVENIFKEQGRKEFIEKILDNSIFKKIDGDVKILVSPHASLEFAASIQAAGYKTILKSNKRYARVIILGPSHFQYFRGFKSFNGDKIEGIIIDKILVRKLIKKVRGFEYDNDIFKKEYSIGRQLVFIKKCFKNTKLIPIIVGDSTKYQLKQLAKTIYKIMKTTNTLLIVSTDMSHYHDKKYANYIDKYSIGILSEIDPNLTYRLSKLKRVEFCGWRSIYIAVYIAKKLNLEFKPILYGDSSSYDSKKVVGYLSALFYKPVRLKYNKKTEKTILRIIKESMINYFKGKVYTYNGEKNKELNEKRGVFITLKKNGKLRACIGSLFTNYPLHTFLPYVARAVLSKDKRFPPIKREEINSLNIEVSIIYDYRRLYSIKKIKLGTDGLYIVKGEKRGVLLPQVAVEHGLNKKQFLMKLCEKASLTLNCYKKHDVRIFRFKALIFNN